MQYLAPTMMLLIGVFIYNEPFTKTYKISFIMIWVAVIIYMISIFWKKKGPVN
jgi:chloramphenicol-sensitive protein RarD